MSHTDHDTHAAHHGFNWSKLGTAVICGYLLWAWTDFAHNKHIGDRLGAAIPGASIEVTKTQGHESINLFCQENQHKDDLQRRMQNGDAAAAKEFADHVAKCQEMHRSLDGFPIQPPPTITGPEPVRASTPATQPPPAFTPSGNGREPVREFQILDAANHSYQLDARAAWTALPNLTAEPGTLEIRTDPTKKACSHSQLPCGGPEGTFDIVGNNVGSEYYPTNKTHYYALVAKWGDSGEVFEIGSYHCKPIPEYAYGRQLYVMANVPATARDLPGNSGGHRILSMQIKK